MKRALALARRGVGLVSPNPAVGAVLVKRDRIIGEGWHKGPDQAHAEVTAINDALKKRHSPERATLYVTLEPCSTFGRTPPCTKVIIEHRIARVCAATEDPNPQHAGRGMVLLKQQGIQVSTGTCESEARDLNPGFNHWIVRQTPLVTIKTAMTLDGKIASASGESKWITGLRSRREVMKMRLHHDAILVGINTILKDDPSLTVRTGTQFKRDHPQKRLRRIVLDTHARTPPTARICNDDDSNLTTIVVGAHAPPRRVQNLEKRVSVWRIRSSPNKIALKTLLKRLGKEQVTSLLVEGGGQVNASFLEQNLTHRIAFFYAPKILGGSRSRPAVGGEGFSHPKNFPRLENIKWRRLDDDLLLTATIKAKQFQRNSCSPESSKKRDKSRN